MMYIGVCGSRSFNKYNLLKPVLDGLKLKYRFITIVTGGATGADSMAESWAKQNSVNCIVYKPDWSMGNHAAFLRNMLIAEKCDELIACFVKGLPCKGTRHTVSVVTDLAKPVTYLEA